VKRFVPGHGFIEKDKRSREELVAFRDAITSVVAEATRLKSLGLSADDAAKRANWGAIGSWFLADQQGPVAVRRVWAEIDGQLR
jgi:hypothetical protein